MFVHRGGETKIFFSLLTNWQFFFSEFDFIRNSFKPVLKKESSVLIPNKKGLMLEVNVSVKRRFDYVGSAIKRFRRSRRQHRTLDIELVSSGRCGARKDDIEVAVVVVLVLQSRKSVDGALFSYLTDSANFGAQEIEKSQRTSIIVRKKKSRNNLSNSDD